MALLRLLLATFALCMAMHGGSSLINLTTDTAGVSAIAELGSHTGSFQITGHVNRLDPTVDAVGSPRSSVPDQRDTVTRQNTGRAENVVNLQRVASTRISLEQAHTAPSPGLNSIRFSHLPLVSSTTGYDLALRRVYLKDTPFSSAPSPALPSAGAGALRYFSFDGRATSPLDISGNGGFQHVVGSPYLCSSDPCSSKSGDAGMVRYRINRLNSRGTVLRAGSWTPLKMMQVTAHPPAPKKPQLPLMEATAYADNGPRAGQFVAERFDVRIAGSPNPRSWNPNIKWAQYRDFASFYYLAEYWKIRDHAAANGWPYEDYMLHCAIDHKNSQRWTKIGKFGEDQPDSLNRATKGVMIANGSSYKDNSEEAWSPATGDVALGNNNKMYIGYPEPFDMINVVIATSRSGGSAAWEYWNGSGWSALTVTDGTAGFSQAAGSTVYVVLFTPPEDWAPVSVNSSRNRFYVRVGISRASTKPVLSRIYGDNWETNNQERGWNNTDPNIIQVAGGYAYNPTPPGAATARFRYQARVRSFWASRNDAFLANDDSQSGPGGIKYWPRYLADGTIESLTSGKHNALLLDNGDSVPENVGTPPLSAMDWATPYTPKARRAAMGMAMQQIVSRVKATHPKAWIGANVAFRRASVCFQLDFCHFENQIQAASQYDYANKYGTDGDLLATFDTLSDPSLNTHGTVGFMVVQNNETIDPLDPTKTAYWWDRADRRPIAALATFYIGWNGDATTGFSYNAHGFTYSQDDNFYYLCCDTVTTTPITGSPTTNPQRFNIADTSQFWNPASRELAVVIGDPPNADYVGITSWTGKTLTTNGIIRHDWPTGTRVTIRKEGRQGSMVIPRDRLLWQSIWFEAMAVDLGVPTAPRNLSWKTAADYGGSAGSTDIRMRPYSKGMVILRPVAAVRSAARMNECSDAMDLGGAYYRLHADGKTEVTPYTSIRLREGEAFIGLTLPTSKASEVPAWQQNPCP